MTFAARHEQAKHLLISFRGLRDELMALTGTPKHQMHAIMGAELEAGELEPVQWIQIAHFMLEDLHQAADEMALEADFRSDCGF